MILRKGCSAYESAFGTGEEKADTVDSSQPTASSQSTDSSQPTESKLSAEEIIARELATSTPVSAHERQIKHSKSKHKKGEKSPVPYLIAIIVIVLLLCGGALLLFIILICLNLPIE